MDSLRTPLLLALGLVVEAGFWDGIGRAFAVASIPHTPNDLGRAAGVAVLFVASQLFQWWRTRFAVRSQVRDAVAYHLPALVDELTSGAAQPAPTQDLTASPNAI